MNVEKIPLVSVLIITYNHEQYIGQALESVLSQETNFPIEVWVGDDASTDSTVQIIERYCKQEPSKIRGVFRDKNIGASANLYDLLQRVRTPYIAFLEGDDYWLDHEKLQKQYSFLQNHLQYVGCTHECEFVDENSEKLILKPLEWISRKREFSMKASKGFYLSGQMGTLFCRNIFADTGGRYDIIKTAHPIISDRTLQMVLALEGNLYRLPDVMSAYRRISHGQGKNATSECFTKNTHSAYDNFMITCNLERYAREYTGIHNLDFSYTKKMFFTSAVYQWLCRRIPDLFDDIVKILRTEQGQMWRYFLFLPRGICHKLIQKLR